MTVTFSKFLLPSVTCMFTCSIYLFMQSESSAYKTAVQCGFLLPFSTRLCSYPCAESSHQVLGVAHGQEAPISTHFIKGGNSGYAGLGSCRLGPSLQHREVGRGDTRAFQP